MYRRRQCIHLPLVIDQLHDIIVKPMLTKDRFYLDYNSRYLDYPLLDFSLKRFAISLFISNFQTGLCTAAFFSKISSFLRITKCRKNKKFRIQLTKTNEAINVQMLKKNRLLSM